MNASTQSLIDGAVVAGLGLVAPLALARASWRWAAWPVAAGCAAAAMAVGPGAGPVAGLLVVPAIGAAAVASHDARAAGDGVRSLAAGWAIVASGALLTSVLGWRLLGQQEPIVRLTAVHFLFAGTGALTVAAATGSALAVRLTAAGPVLVAIGFVTGRALPQVGGAALLAVGVFTTAALQLRAATRPGRPVRRALLVTSGLAIWAPMALAVAWAAGQHWDVPALSVPAMVRWHGTPNAVGFVLCGLLATQDRRAATKVAA